VRTVTYANREVAELLGIPRWRVSWLATRLGRKGCGQGHHHAFTSSEVVAFYVADGLIRATGSDPRCVADLTPAYYVARFARASECPEFVAWICGTEIVIHGNARTIVEKSVKARRLGYVVKVVHIGPILRKLKGEA